MQYFHFATYISYIHTQHHAIFYTVMLLYDSDAVWTCCCFSFIASWFFSLSTWFFIVCVGARLFASLCSSSSCCDDASSLRRSATSFINSLFSSSTLQTFLAHSSLQLAQYTQQTTSYDNGRKLTPIFKCMSNTTILSLSLTGTFFNLNHLPTFQFYLAIEFKATKHVY